MQIHQGIEDFQPLNDAVVTIGTFDGVHVGHQKIIHTLIEIAEKKSKPSVIITFWPHPRKVLHPEYAENKVLFTLEERIKLLKNYNIEHLIIIPFDLKFSKLSPNEFIKNIIVDKIGTKTLILGYDHRFGKDREGSFEYLKTNASNYGLELVEIPRQDIDDMAISSSRIREAIKSCQFEIATNLLGKPYFLTGKVMKGQNLGSKIGFPTANIGIEDEDKIIPPDGVYAVKVIHNNEIYKGMLNIGNRPTVSGTNRTIEAHLFDFEKDIYGQYLEIIFVKKLREEEKFSDINALIKQLEKDRTASFQILSNS